MCRALALQKSVCDFVPLGQPLPSRANNQFRLVEATLAALAGMQWDGHNQRPEILAATLELPDRLGQHVPQHGCSR
jgi:hypothetical protein